MGNEIIEMICKKIGVNERVASKLFELSNNDLDKVDEIYSKSEISEFLLIRGKFLGKRKNINGLFYIRIDINQMELDSIDFFVTYNKNIYSTDINIEFHIFEKILGHYKNQTDLEYEEETKNIIDFFKQYFHPGTVLELLKNFKSSRKDEVKNQINSQMNLAINEIASIEIVTDYEVIIKSKQEEDENYLEASLEIDPFNGKKVAELKKSDEIYIKLTDNSEYGRFISKTIGAKDSPVLRQVESIIEVSKGALETKEYKIVVNIVDDIYAKIYASGEIKVKTDKIVLNKKLIEEELKEYEKDEEEKLNYEKKSSDSLVLIVFMIIIIILIMLGIIMLIR
ncbi:hypothetical protein [Haliovirga abyssi]|uniref:Uncharacterized protein n=1 Tax=Haliovirga abyssi TaxID=2996794 RepID=A0AAU9DVG3_9FUSO|nr:hypothetical protein [Haliovirga abyssi]BDU50131.1 hypothetical protein HLVA_07000 [Haliovirga abyssi]